MEMDTDQDIRLEYRDEYGRVNTKKEMFRQISWQFHGKKASGRNLERRKQRLEQENRFKVGSRAIDVDLMFTRFRL